MNESQLFADVLKLATPQERAAYLDDACAGKPQLRADLAALLDAHASDPDFLEQPAGPLGATVDAAAAPSLPGDNLPGPGGTEQPGVVLAGRYKLLEAIGEGGMGTVWLAQQQEPVKRLVALKVIKPGMDSKQVLARFEAERQALALMDHPHIARVLDAGTTAAGRPFFVMELVEGMPITQYCDAHRLTPRQRLELFIPVCQAIQHAHQKGIIHRDVKPSNVLVALCDDRPAPKVIDFGVAKAIGQQLTEHTLVTGLGAVVGTLEYMSPEQAQLNQLDVDTRSDVYSLGVLLYQLLTGSTPLDRKRLKEPTMLEMLRMVREEEPPKLSARLSDSRDSLPSISAQRHVEPAQLTKLVRGELDWIVMKALEKDRNRRYETTNGFAQDVQRYLADEPVLACPPSAGYRLGKFLRRHKGRALVAALGLVAVVGGGIGSIKAWEQRQVTGLWQQAVAARDGEAKAKREAEDAREKLAAVEYGRTMQVAHQEWRDNNVPACLALMTGTRPDLRGWEWRYLYRLCHSEILTIDTATADGSVGTVRSTAFSADGARVVLGCADGVKVFDARTGALLLILQGHTAGAQSASFSRDGSHLVTGGYDGTAKLWNATTGAEILTFKGRAGAVLSASFSPDGAQVLTGSDDGNATIWDARTGGLVLALTGHTGQVRSAAFGPDGLRVVTGSQDGTAKVWDAKTGAQLLTLRGHAAEVMSAGFSPDGAQVVTGSYDRMARLWDAKTGAAGLILRGHTDYVYAAAFSPQGAQVVTGSWDRTARVWDAKTGAEVLTLKGDTDGITSASFSPDGSRILTGSHGSTAKVWDANRALENYTAEQAPDGGIDRVPFQGNPRPLRVAEFNPDRTRVLTAGQDQRVWLWDAKTGAELLALKGHTNVLTSASFSPDGSRIVTAGYDGTARVWDAATGAELFVLKGGGKVVYSPCFAADGKRIITGGFDGTARVWDAKTGAELLTLKGHAGPVGSIALSADGSRIVTGSWDRTAKVWDARSGAELLTLKGHTEYVVSTAFNLDGTRIITGGLDRTARVWDAKHGAEVFTLKDFNEGIGRASFSRDGARVLTSGGKVWDAMLAPGARDVDAGAANQPAPGREK